MSRCVTEQQLRLPTDDKQETILDTSIQLTRKMIMQGLKDLELRSILIVLAKNFLSKRVTNFFCKPANINQTGQIIQISKIAACFLGVRGLHNHILFYSLLSIHHPAFCNHMAA